MEDDVTVPVIAPAPRVLVVMADQWPRALLRAALRDVGYDAVGTRSLETALRLPDVETDRGPVRLIVLDHSVVGDSIGSELEKLIALHSAPLLLIASATVEAPAGPWQRVLRRPVSVADIVAAVEKMLPIPAAARRPLD